MKPTKLSHSALETYEQCHYKYVLKHVDYVKPFIPIRYPLVTGVAFHQLIDEMYKECNFDLSHLTRKWKPIFLDNLEREGSCFSSTIGHEKYLDYGYGLVKKFHKFAHDEGYLIKPIESEWKFDTEVSGTRIVGKVDLIIQRRSALPIEIIDFKTSWNVADISKVNESKQLAIYGWVARKLLKIENPVVGLFFPRKSQVVLTTPDQTYQEKVIQELVDTYNSIKAGNLEPNYSHCNDCEFKKNCKYFRSL